MAKDRFGYGIKDRPDAFKALDYTQPYPYNVEGDYEELKKSENKYFKKHNIPTDLSQEDYGRFYESLSKKVWEDFVGTPDSPHFKLFADTVKTEDKEKILKHFSKNKDIYTKDFLTLQALSRVYDGVIT